MSQSNADRLAHVLDRSRRTLAEMPDETERSRHAQAIEQLGHYIDLLRDATSEVGARYSLKLELADGRWDVAETDLSARPRIGDLIDLDDGGRWSVRRSQLVRPRPAGKPPREFFVCAPA